MEGLFRLLWDRVDHNARRAVDTYINELPDFRAAAKHAHVRTSMLDFAVLLRRREAELACDGAPFTDRDLAMLAAFGEQRGAHGVSVSSSGRVLDLHDVLTLREIHEAAGLTEVEHVTKMIGWLPVNGLAGHRRIPAASSKHTTASCPWPNGCRNSPRPCSPTVRSRSSSRRVST